jgi:hypothetical protein
MAEACAVNLALVPDAVLLLVAVLVCYVPGLAVLVALRVHSPVLMVAVAPPVSVVVCGLVAIVAAVCGFGYGIVPLLVAVVVLLAVAVVREVWVRRRRRAVRSW